MIVLGYSGYARDTRRGGVRSPLLTAKDGFADLFRFRGGEVPFPYFPIGFFGHDAGAALLRDGEVVACAEEERFTRVKHGLNLAGSTLLPSRAIAFCLQRAGIGIDDVDVVAHYCDFTDGAVEDRLATLAPYLPAADLAKTRASYEALHATMLGPDAVRRQFAKAVGRREREIVPVRHHLAHAASAYYPSGFDSALVLTLDGAGERESSILAVGDAGTLEEVDRVVLPTSLGTLYLVVTVYLGFRSLGDEYKVMGLAAYGDPARYGRVFESLVDLRGDGRYATPALASLTLRDELEGALGPHRAPGDPIEERHADVAAALQAVLCRAVLHQLRHARATTGLRRLCMAGGVALNCALNGAIARSGLFDEIFVQPASSDAGAGLGAALVAYHRIDGNGAERPTSWRDVQLGPESTTEQILGALLGHAEELRWFRCRDVAEEAAARIADGAVVGWFQGRMEFGPRALGCRSILADPREPGMKDRLNELVKWREPFRPFAPAVLEEAAAAWFDLRGVGRSPFMLFTVPVLSSRRADIPAVTHVDGSARLQTVARDVQPAFWSLIEQFRVRTGVPVVLNTSFNVNHEPIVCTAEDAIRCFLRTRIDCLFLEDFVVERRRAI